MGQPKLILQLHIEDLYGTETVLPTDASWRMTFGPVTFSSIYGGEDYDARREQPGWDTPGFDDVSWTSAFQVDDPGGQLVGQLVKPIKVMKKYAAAEVTEPTPGILVYDLGQNFAGWPSITISGERGASIRLTPGELLDSSGFVSQQSAGGGPTYFSYTLKGIGRESWHPRFSYYGFRYVQVSGVATALDSSDKKPRLLALEGQAVHSSAVPVGKFSSSDQLLVRIHNLIRAAITSNRATCRAYLRTVLIARS